MHILQHCHSTTHVSYPSLPSNRKSKSLDVSLPTIPRYNKGKKYMNVLMRESPSSYKFDTHIREILTDSSMPPPPSPKSFNSMHVEHTKTTFNCDDILIPNHGDGFNDHFESEYSLKAIPQKQEIVIHERKQLPVSTINTLSLAHSIKTNSLLRVRSQSSVSTLDTAVLMETTAEMAEDTMDTSDASDASTSTDSITVSGRGGGDEEVTSSESDSDESMSTSTLTYTDSQTYATNSTLKMIKTDKVSGNNALFSGDDSKFEKSDLQSKLDRVRANMAAIRKNAKSSELYELDLDDLKEDDISDEFAQFISLKPGDEIVGSRFIVSPCRLNKDDSSNILKL